MAETGAAWGNRGAARPVLSLTVFVVLLAGFIPLSAPSERTTSLDRQSADTRDVLESLDSLDGYFTENRGQVNELVRYYSRGNPAVAFRDDGVMFVLSEPPLGEIRDSTIKGARGAIRDSTADYRTARSAAYFIHFDGANEVSPVGRGRLPFDSNFLLGNDPDRWTTDVSNYREVIYQNLYEGVDLEYSPTPKGVKYEFVVHPYADPGAIRLRYDGASGVQIEDGGLVVQTAIGRLIDSAPYSFQQLGGEVDCKFVMLNAESYGLVCEEYDRSIPLHIDPLIFSTFLGGSGVDEGYSMALDALGNVYMTGATRSTDFPITPGAFDTVCDWDAFVTKLNATGDVLRYSTFLGGGSRDEGIDIAVDSLGNAYVTGSTSSTDFPTTPAAFDTSFNFFYDAFVAKLNPAGNALVYSTYLGGGAAYGYDHGDSITVDPSGNAYIGGDTSSSDFPTTPGAFDRTFGGGICFIDNPCPDFFVTKLNAAGSSVIYSTFLGGGDLDEWGWIAIDTAGNVYLTGETRSIDFPVTSGALDMVLDGGKDAAVTKLNPTGTDIMFSTFLGGSGGDRGLDIGLDAFRNVYVVGESESADFPTTIGAFDTSYNGHMDAFVTKLNPSGSALFYSTYLGGISGNESPYSIDVSPTGSAYAAGYTESAEFPVTPGAYDTFLNGSCDAFLTKIEPNGILLEYSTLLGGSGCDVLVSATTSLGNIYAVGQTESVDFPVTPGAFDTSFNGGTSDAFVLELSPIVPDLTVLASDIVLNPPGPIAYRTTVTVEGIVYNIGSDDAFQVHVRFDDNDTSGKRQIGVDQVIPEITRFGGTANPSVIWSAEPPGNHTICVLADPDDVIAEFDETNNIACVPVTVLSLPDLTPKSIDIAPPSPMLENTIVRVNVTVANEGDISAGAFDIVLFDDVNGNTTPDSGEEIATRPLSGLGGHSQASESFSWAASPSGAHSLCAFADPPPDAVNESNETNNVKCTSVLVQPGPATRPDYVPISPQPLPPIRAGLSSPVSLSIQVKNQGNATAITDATVAFHEPSSPPLSTFTLAPLAPTDTSSMFTATWTSPAIPGTYIVSVDVDYHDNVTEWDETNNVYTWTIEVVAGPITSLLIGNPNYTATATYVKSTTPLDLSVRDQGGAGINHRWYRIDNLTWIDYASSFFLSGDGDHFVEWYSEDLAGNMEAVNSRTLRVDDSPPATTASIGDPKHLVGGNFVTSSTPITLQAVDGGTTPAGIQVARYRIDSGGWKDYSSPLILAGEGTHTVEYYSIDLLTNQETAKSTQFIVDNTPPTTTHSIGSPKYIVGGNFVKSSTPLTLQAVDGGATPVGVLVIKYRIDGGNWNDYSSSFTLSAEGARAIEYYSRDLLTNEETIKPTQLIVDNSPPATTLYPATGPYTIDKLFTLAATDSGSGVKVTRCGIDGSTPADYSGGFTVPAGVHNISYFSIDNLDNTEQEKWLVVTVQGPPPPNTPPSVTLTSPIGGEEWLGGSSHIITWTMHDDQDVDANLTVYVNYTIAGVTYPIVAGLMGGESFLWALPDIEVEDIVVNVTVIDMGGMKGWDQSGPFIINSIPQPSVEANYKPLVALVFAFILAVVGIWSSKRRPWKGGKDRMAVAKAFALFSAPFILAEAATGIVSLVTGEMRVPPYIGVGAAIDLSLFLSGLGAAIPRALRKQRGVETINEPL